MSDSTTLKDQRDKFLAFAFASADLLFEIAPDGTILFATGASKSLTGFKAEDWIGKNWLDLFRPYDQAAIQSLMDRTEIAKREGPMLFDLHEDIAHQKGILTGIKMPDNDNYYATLSFSTAISTHIAELERQNENLEISDPQSFTIAAEEAVLKAKSNGTNITLSTFDFTPTQEHQKRLGAEKWQELNDGLCNILFSHSFDGRTAGKTTEGRYNIIQNANIDTGIIQKEMEDFLKAHDDHEEQINIKSKTIQADLQNIEPKDITKALVYSINEFERSGHDIEMESLSDGLNIHAQKNAEKLKEFQDFINRSDFKMNFQPIINLQTMKADHYEVRCSFDHGNTQEWVMFGEDTGLSASFDMAICERAINYINFNAGTTWTRFSMNLSALSFDDKEFSENLIALLDKHENKKLPERLLFEITESVHITNKNNIFETIEKLVTKGFTITLDDFEVNDHTLSLITDLPIHAVKADGKIISKITHSHTDLALLKDLVKHCESAEKTIIAKAVEDEEQIKILKEIGINFGQGYHFGKPSDKPDYTGITT